LQNLDTNTSQDSYPQLKNKPAESRPPLSLAAPSKLLLEANFDDELEFQKDSAILRMEIDGRNSQISELRDLNARLTSELEQVKSELAEVLDAKTGYFLFTNFKETEIELEREKSLKETILSETRLVEEEKSSIIQELSLIMEDIKEENLRLKQEDPSRNQISDLAISTSSTPGISPSSILVVDQNEIDIEELMTCIESMQRQEKENENTMASLEKEILSLHSRFTEMAIQRDVSEMERNELASALQQTMEENKNVRQIHLT
jgi:hypothetical protein